MQYLTHLLTGYWSELEVATNMVILINIIGALLLGLMVGYERSYRGRAAGMRTYGLVCMAACALTVITGYPQYWYGGHSMIQDPSPGHVIQGIVTGVGFLGAGVIMRDGLNISGLTTAASIWSVAVIGVLVGVGFYAAAIPLAAISTIFMMWGSKLESILPSRHAIFISILFNRNMVPNQDDIIKIANDLGYDIARGSFGISKKLDQHEWKFVAVSKGRKISQSLPEVGNALAGMQGIENYSISHARN